MGRPTNAERAARAEKKAAEQQAQDAAKGEASTPAVGAPPPLADTSTEPAPAGDSSGDQPTTESTPTPDTVDAAAAPPPIDPPPPPVTFTPPPAPPVTLEDYIRQQVALKLKRNIMLVSVTYPGATQRVFDATYCGVRVTSGPLGCVWSDGSTE